ncbi:hypothetical protein P43SY_008467 [Pythium insidiosum]|uniref:Uncharacterized protein n=1 Tax=Pythium insidiosum TaxID=114742 RepID=A0AAD5M9I0_PYTIN|nr:hypothetical protein P43SY_008467 [Pythium insidiosum]
MSMGRLLLVVLCACAAAMSAVASVEASNTRLLRADAPVAAAENDKQAATEPSHLTVHRVYDPVSGLYCEKIGDCHACPASEKTGHRQELRCPRPGVNGAADTKEILFKACSPVDKAHPFVRVFTFEIVMIGLFAASFVLLQKERRKHLSPLDVRKDARQQRSSLLGTTVEKNAD